MRNIDIKDMGGIDELKDILHDRFYDVEKIEYNSDQGQLTIPTSIVLDDFEIQQKGLFKSKKYPVVKAYLYIYNVSKYQVVDIDEINEGDFGSIIYDGEKITISGSAPVKLIVSIKSLSVSLEITDQITTNVSGFRKDYLRS